MFLDIEAEILNGLKRHKPEAAATAAFYIERALGQEKDRSKSVGGSDAGACIRALTAQKRGLLDIDEDFAGLLRMDQGTMLGAWYAALAYHSVNAKCGLYRAGLEQEFESNGIPCHADFALFALGQGTKNPCVYVVDFKSTNSTAVPKEPINDKPSQVAQLGIYMDGLNAPLGALVVISPAIQNREKKIECGVCANKKPAKSNCRECGGEGMIRQKQFPPRIAQFEYSPQDTFPNGLSIQDAARAEITRLKRALLPVGPLPLPDLTLDQMWRCESCRLSDCSLNRNPNARELVL